jgi:transcription-repair coupling factor (superfamily II helicase)
MEKAIKELRGEKVEKEIEPEIDLRISAFLPESYIPDTNQRLIIYKKLSSSITEKEVSDIEGEIIDLYGDPPPQAENLLKIIKIKNFLKKLKVKRLDFNGREIVLSLDGETGILPERIVKLISQDQKRFTFTPDLKLFFLPKDRSRDGILRETGNLLQELSEVNRG